MVHDCTLLFICSQNVFSQYPPLLFTNAIFSFIFIELLLTRAVANVYNNL